MNRLWLNMGVPVLMAFSGGCAEAATTEDLGATTQQLVYSVFTSAETTLSISTRVADFVHPDPAASPVPWSIGKVYNDQNKVLKPDWWRLDVDSAGDVRSARLTLLPGFETSTDPADVRLQQALANKTKLRVKIRFDNGAEAFIYLQPVP